MPEPDPAPVVRFFNPIGAATWLATEIDEDDILFGLADLGFGCPELGSFSLAELESIQLPLDLGIERDISFEGRHPLSVYAEAARQAGSLLTAECILQTLRLAANRAFVKSERGLAGFMTGSGAGSSLTSDDCMTHYSIVRAIPTRSLTIAYVSPEAVPFCAVTFELML
ncbi:DUF2958 domain-containing protein [Nostoc sp. CHAB 5824]|nr:DUF2958 domain-containing protein [Nostoc sp. CHAB 5824]